MKSIRWILSHLTVIVVLSLIIYVYWHFDDIWPDKALTDNTIHVRSHEGKDNNFIREKQDTGNHSTVNPDIGIQNTIDSSLVNKSVDVSRAADLQPQDGFLERKKHYQESQLAGNTQAGESEPDGSQANRLSGVNQQKMKEILTISNAENGAGKNGQNAIQEAIGKAHISNHHKQLLTHMMARKQHLNQQVVSLISDAVERVEDTTVKKIPEHVQPVKPYLETPEQGQLLKDARQAFDQQNYKLAEEKYLQLMNELPQLPDVAGELANVYKTQHRQVDYLAMNTRFVKRLAEHYRFEEAWRVVKETDKLDKPTADKQRRIINNVQKELEL